MPQIKRYCLTYFSVLLFFLISCSTGTDIEDTIIQELKTELKEKPAEWIIHPGTEYLYEANFLTSSDGCEYIIAVDRATSKIFLFNKAGDLLDEAGGEGDGPDEYRGIVSIHISYDNKLYLVDGVLNRVSIYSISEGYLEYLTSMAYENQPEYFLNSVYVTEYGNYGVYQQSEGFFSPESKFYLYRLDENFEPIDRLIEMPGNEKMSLGEFSHIDHIVGKKTLWDLDGEWFYHISSHSPIINRYNLRTGESTASVYFDLEEREVTGEKENYLKEFASNMIDRFPEVGEEIITVKSLPFFEEFLVRNNTLYLVLFDIEGREQTEIIRINEVTEEVHYIDIPLKLWRIKAGNGVIYGIDTTENSSLIQIIDLEE